MKPICFSRVDQSLHIIMWTVLVQYELTWLMKLHRLRMTSIKIRVKTVCTCSFCFRLFICASLVETCYFSVFVYFSTTGVSGSPSRRCERPESPLVTAVAPTESTTSTATINMKVSQKVRVFRHFNGICGSRTMTLHRYDVLEKPRKSRPVYGLGVRRERRNGILIWRLVWIGSR